MNILKNANVVCLQEHIERRKYSYFNNVHMRNMIILMEISDFLDDKMDEVEESKEIFGENIMDIVWSKITRNNRMEIIESLVIIRKKINDIEREITLQ